MRPMGSKSAANCIYIGVYRATLQVPIRFLTRLGACCGDDRKMPIL
ncbi:MAG: hypothetical protein HONBIEJF_00319 [Fimbriimonadaceae bacterium]|nr:hypothetical protein [Fimbriimonadaceae bacterium]